MIETVKYDGGVTGDYMRLMEDEEYLRECGNREGRQQSIIKVLETHFPVADEIREKIYAQEDLGVLDEWLLAATNAMTLEDFASRMQ